MEVAFVTSEYPPKNVGGAGISSELIVEGLREMGISVDVFALNGEDESRVRKGPNRYELPSRISIGAPEIIERNVSVYRHLPDLEAYDVVHAYSPGHLPAVVLRSDVPVIGTIVNFGWVCINSSEYLRDSCPEYGFRRALRNAAGNYSGVNTVLAPLVECIGKSIAKRTDTLTVQTEGMRRILSSCGYDARTIEVIPNLVDPRFQIDSRSDPSESRTLVSVGRLTEQKGMLDIVQAFTNLSRDVRDGWTLEIYGSGPLEEDIRRHLNRNNDAAIKISYCPYEEMPDRVYSRAAAVIHGAKWPEPFSRVWLEAMASGTPIICSENPSSRCVLDGIAEFYNPFDSESLHNALRRMLTSPSRRDRFSELAKQAVYRYEQEPVIERYIRIYERAKD